MGNEATKKQIRDFFDAAYKKFQNPDKREILKKARLKRREKVARRFGF